MDNLTLSAETYKKLLPSCAPGETVTVAITGANGDTAQMTGTITSAKDGITIPLSGEAEGADEDASAGEESDAKKVQMSPAAMAAMSAGNNY